MRFLSRFSVFAIVVFVMASFFATPVRKADAAPEDWKFSVRRTGEVLNGGNIDVTFKVDVFFEGAGDINNASFVPKISVPVTPAVPLMVNGKEAHGVIQHAFTRPDPGQSVSYIAVVSALEVGGTVNQTFQFPFVLHHTPQYYPTIGSSGLGPVTTIGDVNNIIAQILGILQFVLFSIAGIFVVIAGYQYLTAQGDPEKTANARNIILFAVVAVGIGLLATFIKQLVLNLLNAQ